ncbi:MAG: hypothetical protein AAB321_03190 [Chloroflexota bacterium]
MSDDLRSSVEPAKSRRRVVLIVLAVAGLLLCCCGSLVLAWYFGDSVLETLLQLFQLQ